MTRRDLIKALIYLSGKTPSRIAEEAGLSRSNVTHWLKYGGSSVGVERQDELLERLGVSGGTLASDRVHRWTIEHNLEALREILTWSKKEFEAVFHSQGDTRFCGQIKIVVGLFDPSKSIRILLRQKISPMIADREIQFLDPLNPETIPHVKWLDPDPRENLFPAPFFIEKVLDPKSEILPEEFDRFFKSLTGSTKVREEIPTKQRRSLTFKELEEILARAEDWSVDSGVLREDIRTLIDHIETLEEKRG